MTMTLGTYTFDKDPQDCTQPIKNRRGKELPTLGGVQYFSWGLYIEGQIITMRWPGVSTDQYNNMRSQFYGDEQIVWDPDLGDSSAGGRTYNVQVKSLAGEFHMSKKTNALYRKNVVLKMVIMSEV